MGKKNNQKKGKKANAKRQTQSIRLRQDLLAQAKQFNLLSNVFMSVALNDIPACQHVLRIITGIKDLKVKEVRTQYHISKLTSHDAVLDILAEDGEGKLYNIEIQRGSTLDHARRTRFYGSMIDCEFLQKGINYDEMPEVQIIYITEKDIWKKGKAIYQVQKLLDDEGEPYNDGKHVTYVNAAVDDGSAIAKLMDYFKTADPTDMSQGDLSKRVQFLKCEKGGHDIMCQITERILEEGKKAGKREGRREGKREGRREGKREGRREGRREGKLEGKREGKQEQARLTVLNLAKMGVPVEKIAEIVEVNIGLVKNWVEEKKMV